MSRVVERKRHLLRYLFDPNYIEHRRLEGWSGMLPFYLCFCSKHGYYETYPHGYHNEFRCPKCLEDLNVEKEEA